MLNNKNTLVKALRWAEHFQDSKKEGRKPKNKLRTLNSN
jgi:hypothetical protein